MPTNPVRRVFATRGLNPTRGGTGSPGGIQVLSPTPAVPSPSPSAKPAKPPRTRV